MLARPDANTFQLLPWHGHGQAGSNGDDARGPGGPGVLRHRQPRRLALPGLPPPRAAPDPRPGPRPRLHLLRRPGDRVLLLRRPPTPPTRSTALDSGSYFELTVADRASDIRQRTVLTLEEMGIPVEHAQHEDAPSQHEIDLRYTDALTMADTVMTVRLVVKEMARQQGVFASFMPKPLAGVQGSGMHTHMSLFRGRHQRLRRPRPPRRAVRGGRGVHRRPAAPRPGDHRGDQPVGQLLQAAGVRLRGPHPRVVGPQQPIGPGPGAGGQAGEVRVDPGRVPVAGQRLQSVPGLRRHPGRRAPRASRRGTGSRPRPTPTCSRSAPRSWPTRGSSTCPAA